MALGKRKRGSDSSEEEEEDTSQEEEETNNWAEEIEDFLQKEEKEGSWRHDLALAFHRNWKDSTKRKKGGRQGRSKESREKARKSKEENKDFKVNYECCINEECKEAHSNFIEDLTSGDVICLGCGVVQFSKGLGFTEHIELQRNKSKSKKYQKVVHWCQRWAQLIGTDPRIKKFIFEEICKHINPLMYPRFGKKSLSLILKKIGKKELKRLSANWIQVRRRLKMGDIPEEVDNPQELYLRMHCRYICVAQIFQEKLFSEEGEKGGDSLKRRNIINVNYVMVQLLRIESEEVFKAWARFFPQLHSKRQPRINNQRWKIIVEECHKRYTKFSLLRTEETLHFTWPYKELSKQDIEKHCSYFD